jgi:hypothetical protein
MSIWVEVRKRPVAVSAARHDGSLVSANTLALVVGGRFSRIDGDEWSVSIDTLEGTMTAMPGDWIIRGVQGEFYPCKPDIFEATYEVMT